MIEFGNKDGQQQTGLAENPTLGASLRGLPTPRIAFFGLSAAEFDDAVVGWGWPRFRAQQVRDWVYGKRVTDPAAMKNLSKRDQETLRERVAFATSVVTARQASNDGTQKLLLTWADAGAESFGRGQGRGSDDQPAGAGGDVEAGSIAPARAAVAGRALEPPVAECVMIPDADRRTACISSQVGCPVGCKFCASGINGVKGNLTAAQIVEQVYRLNEMLAESGGVKKRSSDEADGGPSPLGHSGNDSSVPGHPRLLRRLAASSVPSITNIVFMGMGEPLSNYANVMKAIAVLHDPKCFNLGARRITISTVGVPARMRQLAGEGLPINLAISLHAPNEPLRKQLIPWAEHFALEDILDAARTYFAQTGREITLEYILLSGVNDQPDHARELARLCKTVRANVNLIRYNEVAGLPFARPRGDDVVRFQEILRANGVNAHVRKSRGRDIDAACGQLRRKRQDVATPPLVTFGAGGA